MKVFLVAVVSFFRLYLVEYGIPSAMKPDGNMLFHVEAFTVVSVQSWQRNIARSNDKQHHAIDNPTSFLNDRRQMQPLYYKSGMSWQCKRRLRNFRRSHERLYMKPKESANSADDDELMEASTTSGLGMATKDPKSFTTTPSRYEDSDATSKGLVSSLTDLVNTCTSLVNGMFVDAKDTKSSSSSLPSSSSSFEPSTLSVSCPPKSPQELLERIRDDYTERNYLWTGNIDLESFDMNCRFTDPTLSFTGRDKFVENTGNLVPIVEAITTLNSSSSSKASSPPPRSDLLGIDLNEKDGYVQSRWNMVGDLVGLPWKPRIDVIGRTKFWYQKVSANVSSLSSEGDRQNQKPTAMDRKGIDDGDDGEDFYYQVTFYDEEWEIPAGKALLQLITPAGTMS